MFQPRAQVLCRRPEVIDPTRPSRRPDKDAAVQTNGQVQRPEGFLAGLDGRLAVSPLRAACGAKRKVREKRSVVVMSGRRNKCRYMSPWALSG